MLDYILDSLRPRLALLSDAWLASGATLYGIWEDGRPLAHWPAHGNGAHGDMPCITMPIRTDNAAPLELRVVGADGLTARGRLRGEAALLAYLIQLEDELEELATRLGEVQDQLLALFDLAHAMRSHASIEATLNALAREAARLTGTDSAFAVLAMPNGAHVVARQPVDDLDREQAVKLFRRTQTSQQEWLGHLTLDGGDDAHLFVIPILVQDRILAALGLVNRSALPFTSPEMKLARAIAEQGGAGIESALLLQERLAQTRIQTEMELAKHVQLRLLPRKLPRVPGLEIAAYSSPALQVGGDFYDFIHGAGQTFTFAVGDVSGKGMGAALPMSMMHTVIHTVCRLAPHATPAALAAQMTTHLYEDLTEIGAFVTTFVGQYEATTRRLGFANAGHSPVIYCPHDAAARLLEADAPPVGVLPVSLCQDQSLPLRPGDLLIVATDGFSEAENAAGEMYGYERLLQLSKAHALLPAAEILTALCTAVQRFSAGHPQDDDQTVVVVKGVQA